MNSKYKKAETISKQEKEYVESATAFLVEYGTLVDYLNLYFKVADQFENEMAAIEAAPIVEVETDEEYVQETIKGLETVVAQLTALKTELEKLTPPKWLASDFDADIESLSAEITEFTTMINNAKEGGIDAVSKDEKQLEQAMAEEAGISMVDYYDKLQSESPIAMNIESLEKQAKDLDSEFRDF